MNDVAAVILAAGRGTRFDAGPKLLTSLDGKPLVRHVAQAAIISMAEPVIVVTGDRSDEVEAVLGDMSLRFVSNPSYAEGLSTSLKAGFAALPAHTKAAVILLGDMPRIRSDLIDALARAWLEMGKPTALIPTLGGRRGNPVVLSRALEKEITGLTGDKGAAAILRDCPDVVEYPVQDPSIFQDVDTIEEFRKLSGEV